jgi:hypothetical protein
MAALGGFKVLDFLHFCRRFKKKPSFSKSRLAPKKPSNFQKAGNQFWRVVLFENHKCRKM